MNKLERFEAAMTGRPVDRPPFTIWYHFGLQHAPAERTAQAHAELLEAYDLDWLKLMNDYSYPMPPGLEDVRSPSDLARLAPFDVAASPMREQLRVLDLLRADVAARAPFVDTMFNAWNTLRRNVVKDAMGPLMREHPKALEAALAIVNDNLIRYARASLDHGAFGIFLSVPASEEFVTREEYERFMRPYDVALLEAIAGRGRHILHAHGNRLYWDRMLDHPVAAISWGDRDGGPSLAQARTQTPLALMGGIGHGGFAYSAAAKIRAEIREAVKSAGRDRLFVAPGCSVATYAFPELIRVARDEARRV